jgi:pimeloyl-ACP methyl ester carboxylesterase
MSQKADLDDFYKTYSIKSGIDSRTPQKISEHSSFVKRLTHKNLGDLQIQLTPKLSQKYTFPTLKRIDLEDGIYCNVTDNSIESELAIVTLHGAPGHVSEWAGLEEEMKGRYRWINMMIPGFDGEDERRGTYDGTLKGFENLFFRLAKSLKLKRVVICAHSFGTTVGFHLASTLPFLIEGFINIAGVGSVWPNGMSFMYKATVVDLGYHQEHMKKSRLFDKDEHRGEIYQKYVNNFQKNDYSQYKIPLLSQSEYFGFLRLAFKTPMQFDELFHRYGRYPKLRVLAFGASDPIYSPDRISSTICTLLSGECSYLHSPHSQKLFKVIKSPLERRLKKELGIEIEGDRIQEYLCFSF